MKPSREEVARVVERALNLLSGGPNSNNHRWMKGQWRETHDNVTTFCALGAIREAAPGPRKQQLRDEAAKALSETICGIRISNSSLARDEVIGFNDRKGTQWEKVRDTFSDTVKRLRGR